MSVNLYDHFIPDDMYPEVTIVEPRPQDSVGAFARTLSREVGFRIMQPDTGARGWLRSLYLSGEAIMRKMQDDFWKYETDVYLFSNSSRVADARGLLLGYLNQLPLATWIHSGEGVLSYDLRDPASMANNIASFFVCDKIYGGSEYCKEILTEELQSFRSDITAPESAYRTAFAREIADKFELLPIGYDYKRLLLYISISPRPRTSTPVVLWNHRIDFDRNPGAFARIMLVCRQKGLRFKLILACDDNKRLPVWAEMKKEYGDDIIHRGFARGEDYLKLLAKADIVMSTATTETFGFSVAEAAVVGAVPIIPNLGSYKSLYPSCFRYSDEQSAVQMLKTIHESFEDGLTEQFYSTMTSVRKNICQNYDWEVLKERYLESFRNFWIERERRIPPQMAKSTEKAAKYIDTHKEVSKLDLLVNGVGWGGLDYYGGLRWKLLNNGYRTFIADEGTENQRVIWHRA